MPAERAWDETNHAGDNRWTERCRCIILIVAPAVHHIIDNLLFVGKFYKLLAKLCPQPVPVVVQIAGSGAHFSLRLPHHVNACDSRDGYWLLNYLSI